MHHHKYSRTPVFAICASFRASLLIGSSIGVIITAHSCSFPLVILHLTATTRNENFLVYSVRILNSCVVYKFQTVNPWCPTYPPHTFWSTAMPQDIRAALYFCSCESSWRSTECVLLPCFKRVARYFCNHELLCLRRPLIKFMFITVTHCSLQQRVKRVCVEWYAQGCGEWRHYGGIPPSALLKGGQRERRCQVGVNKMIESFKV